MIKLPFLPRKLIRLFAAGVIFSLALVACGGAPAAAPPDDAEEPQTQATEIVFPTALPTSAPVVTVQPTIPERRYLALEFPPRIRAGDSDIVRLTLDVDKFGNLTPTAEVEGNVVTGEVIEIPNLYESHHVIAEARFDMAGVEVSPPDLFSQTLSQGQTVRFFWSVRPREVGVYRGTIWLYLRFVDKSSGAESRKTVSAQIVEIEAVNLFGLSANFARGTGIVGSVIGAVIGFPFFEDIVKFLFKRRRERRR